MSYPLSTVGHMTRPKPHKPPKVAGEPVDLLRSALLAMHLASRDDDYVGLRAEMTPEAGCALVRAVMRIEAELLLTEARTIGPDHQDPRDDDDRRLEAFLIVIRRTFTAQQATGSRTGA